MGNRGQGIDDDADNVVVPEGEGPLSQAITVRLPRVLLARIEQAAKQTHNNRSDTILYLLRWGITAHEKQQQKGKKR